MKRLIAILGLTASLFTACDKHFGEYNLNPDAAASVDPSLLFSGALVSTSSMDMEPRTNYCHAFMQYGYFDFWSGTTYSLSDYISSKYWNSFYGTVLKNLEYAIAQMQTRKDLVNTYAAARIWRVFVYQKLTDFYGDIPYSQAGQAITQRIFTPAYDPQEEIYRGFVSELTAAADLLNAGSAPVKNDQFYQGDVSRWKKLAFSLLLRIGMRLIRVDPVRASALVQQAVAGGVMTGNSDMPVLLHNSSSPNGFSFNLGDEHFFLHATLVDHLKNTGDPRLAIYGAIHSAAEGSILSTDTAEYIGYSFKASSPAPTVRVSYPIYQPANTPFFDFQYAQVAFLLAEAVLRGYITGDANSYYQNGIRAHMQSLALLPTAPTIPDAAIAAYLTRNPLVDPANPSAENQIARINTEYWVAGFIFDADEVWANWRRTGYPDLAPNPNTINGPGNSPGVIPRKMPYPQSEFDLNNAQVTKALANYGGTNDFNAKARVWWDP